MITKFNLFENFKNTKSDLYGSLLLGKTGVLNSYLKQGGDINVIFYNGENMLYVAAKNGFTHIMDILIKNNIDLNWVDWKNRSILILMCGQSLISKSEDIVKILVDAGADLNIQDSNQMTALMTASQYSEMGLIDLLIDTNWNLKSDTDIDFLGYLNKKERIKVIEKYPKHYKDYLLNEDLEKFNI